MGGCLSSFEGNDGAFEQPGHKEIAAFVTGRDKGVSSNLHRILSDDDVVPQSPLSPTPTSSTSKTRPGNSSVLDPAPKTHQTAVFPQKRKSTIHPIPEPVRRTVEAPPVPVPGPSTSTSTSTSTISEKRQGELVAQLYSSNIPAEDIALVVKAMRGGCTKEEHAQLLPKLFELGVSSTLVAQLMDTIRAAPRSSANAAVVRSDDAGEMPDEPPPVYDFKATHVLEYTGAP